MNCRISNVATTATLAGLLAALMAASPAGAVDGVIEINQARALAGGVTPGDTPGYPVTISQRGSYRLTGELAHPSADGVPAIDITSKDVTLDLNGFKIATIGGVCSSPSIQSSVPGTKLYNGVVDCDVKFGPNAHVEGLLILVGDLEGNNGQSTPVDSESIVTRNRVSIGSIYCPGLCTIRENLANSVSGLGGNNHYSRCSDNVLSEPVTSGCRPAGANLCCDLDFGNCFDCP